MLVSQSDYLRSDEQVLVEDRIRARWIVHTIVGDFVFLGFLAFVPTVVALAEPTAADLAWLVWALFGASFFVLTIAVAWRRVVTTRYTITNETAYAKRGRILLRIESVPLDKVTDVTVHTGLLDRVLGLSALTVRTAGGMLRVVGVRDAYRLGHTIRAQRREFVLRLLEEAGRGEEEPSVPEPSRPKNDTRCPNCQVGFPAPGPRPVDVVCPSCGLEGTLFEEVSV